MDNTNAYDSFKKDVGKITNVAMTFAFIFFLIFPPLLFVNALGSIEASQRPEFWKRALKHPTFWLWWLYFGFVITAIVFAWMQWAAPTYY